MSRNKKTLLVCLTPGNGLTDWVNLGNYSREIAIYHEYVRQGWSVIFATFNYREDLELISEDRDFKLIKCWHRYLLIFAPLFLSSVLRDVDLVKTNQSWRSWWYVCAAKLFNKPILLRTGWLPARKYAEEWRFNPKYLYYRAMDRFAFQNADLVQVTSKSDRAWLVQNYGVAIERINVVPNFVDVEIFCRLNVDKIRKSICFVGRLDPQKNLDLLIDAAAAAGVEAMLFVGDGPLGSELLKQASVLKVPLKIISKAKNEDIPTILAPYEVFCLISSYEGRPKALIEAMACGLACVGSDIDGINTLLKDRETGLIVGSALGDLVQALKILFADRKLSSGLGNNARNFVMRNFSKQSVCNMETQHSSLFCKSSPK